MLALPDTRLLPAHGPVRDSTHARVHQLLEHHETRLAQTLEAASDGPVTAFAAAGALPWTRRKRKLTELDPMNQLLATGETAAHLEVLVLRGQLARVTSARRHRPLLRALTSSAEPLRTPSVGRRRRPPGCRDACGMSVRSGGMRCVDEYTPGQLARVLGLPEPTAEQAAVIGRRSGRWPSSPGRGRARARRWPRGWSGWSPTAWSARTGCSA